MHQDQEKEAPHSPWGKNIPEEGTASLKEVDELRELEEVGAGRQQARPGGALVSLRVRWESQQDLSGEGSLVLSRTTLTALWGKSRSLSRKATARRQARGSSLMA